MIAAEHAEHEDEGAHHGEDGAQDLHALADRARCGSKNLRSRRSVRDVMRAHGCVPGAPAAVSARAALGDDMVGGAYGTGRVGAVCEYVGTAGPFSPGCPAGSVDTGAPSRPCNPRR